AAAAALTDGRRMPRADVVALQEADRATLRAGGRHVARELAEAAGMSFVRAAMATPRDEEPKKKQWYLDFEEQIRRGEEGDTGVALLARVPLADAERVELPWTECAWRPRLALSAEARLGGARLRVFNVHIDPHANLEEQLAQHRAVLDRADEWRGPCAVLGDFNTLSRRSCDAARDYLESRGYRTPLPTGTGTWRAGPLRLHADWIFTRGLRVERWGVARGLGVSDHWPVWAEVAAEGD
ncbi:MAG TPA: endonuclease/exonuclease/phosphatase family protein, partial [Pyrinomonadaceae bacterium]|nr:endonuclease/exonuclease/phosphatase family protein [Pyrinomonadaceae bacterium]